MNKIILAIVTTLFLLGCGSSKSKSEVVESTVNICESKEVAYEESKEFIDLYLKAPATAVYKKEPSDYNYIGDCKHWILSYVDSKNGFGVLNRNNFEIEIMYDEVKKDWLIRKEPTFW